MMIIQTIRSSKVTKIVSSYLAIQMILQLAQPDRLWALTGGPAQPEFNSFTPIGTSDMVDLASGDFNYNIPIMDVGGYPLNLAYNSGITMDQEASWVGLGWNLNVGQIARNVRGLPDDFKGDKLVYENDRRDNVTIGVNFSGTAALFGSEFLRGSAGLGVEYNNSEGISFRPSFGTSYGLNDKVALGLNVSSSTGGGASVAPSVSISDKSRFQEQNLNNSVSGDLGIGLNSRKGLDNMSLSFSNRRTERIVKGSLENLSSLKVGQKALENTGGVGTGISFNDQTNFTPSRRFGTTTNSFTFTGSFGATFFGAQGQAQVTGYGSYQKVNDDEKSKSVSSYGYQYTESAGASSMLDFNREKDGSFSKYTTVLPVTNYSYDLYAIQGQGIGGMFRPFRSQVGYVSDPKVSDYGGGATFGAEIGGGNAWYGGAKIEITNSSAVSRNWTKRNNALAKFQPKELLNAPSAEKVYFRALGDLALDHESELYQNNIHGEAPMYLSMTGDGKSATKSLRPSYNVKQSFSNGIPSYADRYKDNSVTDPIIREKRHLRNQSISVITQKDALDDPLINSRSSNAYVQPHHTVGVKILKPDGITYVFGESVYNRKKIEATFDVSSRSGDCNSGLVSYNGNIRGNHSNNSDRIINRITTPSYAHTYGLSSILSTDYEDLTGDGPTDDDLGSYTKFIYGDHYVVNDYKWRVPFEEHTATFNEGMKTHEDDETGNYLYGEKELKYVSEIETKTHVAVFELTNRNDAIGVKGEHGGKDATSKQMKKIDKIYLFSKPEYTEMLENDSYEELKHKKAIKVAHFEYDYSLCQASSGVLPNNNGSNYDEDGNEIVNQGGKLTLQKVYFTYRGSYMGKYTPYTFEYNENYTLPNTSTIKKYAYNVKGYDIWGNYKPNEGSGCHALSSNLSAPEFPFVEQDRTTADLYSKAWNIKAINLPSGGRIEVETESDDYGLVQTEKAMQMYKVVGAGDRKGAGTNPLDSNQLFNGSDHKKYVYIQVPNGTTTQDFDSKYVSALRDQPIYFRFLLNMVNQSSTKYDYVAGYFNIDTDLYDASGANVFEYSDNTYAAIPLKKLKREGGLINSGALVNPITKAGWHFGRTYLNRSVYSIGGVSSNKNFESIVGDLVSSIGSVAEIFTGPNKKLQDKECARKFVPNKSWIRLLHPDGGKLGGGLRVKKLQMLDNWDAMLDEGTNYAQQYGQEYEYTNTDGSSSGVATFEPNGSKENPLVQPFFDKAGGSYADRIASPKTANYTEKPIGETFFPSATVTYGRVTVKNLQRHEGNNVVKKHATGKVVSEFYTSNDFPTITDYTSLDDPKAKGFFQTPKILAALKFSVKNALSLSQGFVVITNDMNGKPKSQQVFAEDNPNAISGVTYEYHVSEDDPKRLDNNLLTINPNGEVSKKLVGQHYDVVNDFRENYSKTVVGGVDANLTTFLAAFIPGIVPLPLPNYAKHENTLHLATTTKVIHKVGILKRKTAFDLGATVSTENLAWDAVTGQELLTQTVNEYNDHYYNFTYPAYWAYKNMGLASETVGFETYLRPSANEIFEYSRDDSDYTAQHHLFTLGDELMTYTISVNGEDEVDAKKLWVVDIKENGLVLMDNEGNVINQECSPYTREFMRVKIIRSGKRNQQLSSMASLTSMYNPIKTKLDGSYENISMESFRYSKEQESKKIINASAVRYRDYWRPLDEHGLPILAEEASDHFSDIFENEFILNQNTYFDPKGYGFNPYLYNVRGAWRMVKSYAYLTGRNGVSKTSDPSLKDQGYFTEFSPYYVYNTNTNNWTTPLADFKKWTFASAVTQYSSYGPEVENRDALYRYSAAQYGYANTLPIAVASNTKYREMGFDGFEDYEYNSVFNNAPSGVGDTQINDGKGYKRDHFSFRPLLEQEDSGVKLTTEVSHTGAQSLKLEPNTIARQSWGKDTTIPYVQLLDYNCLEDLGRYDVPAKPEITYTATSQITELKLRNSDFINMLDSGEISTDFHPEGHHFRDVIITDGSPNQRVFLKINPRASFGGIFVLADDDYDESEGGNFDIAVLKIVEDNRLDYDYFSYRGTAYDYDNDGEGESLPRSIYTFLPLDENGNGSFRVFMKCYFDGGEKRDPYEYPERYSSSRNYPILALYDEQGNLIPSR